MRYNTYIENLYNQTNVFVLFKCKIASINSINRHI